MQSSRLVRVVFAVLVLGTVGTFFATQRLKTEVPVVLRFAGDPRHISPNNDGVRDSTRVGFDLSEPAEVSFSVVDSEGKQVRQIFSERRLAGDTKHRFRWDGRDDDGTVVPDGRYRLRVVRRDQAQPLDSIKKIIVDTRPPRVQVAAVRPNVISPGVRGGARRVRVRYRGPLNAQPEFRVWRTDVIGPPEIVRRFRGSGRTGVWDGSVRDGPTRDGSYAFTVVVRDKAGNRTEAPSSPIPTAATARPRTGVDVRRLTLQGPSAPVSAGSLARLRVGPVTRRFRFALSRLGSTAALRQDTRRGGRLRVRIPDDARTGIYLVRVRVPGHRAVWPVVVNGRPAGGQRALRRPRPLVILPLATWQGVNQWDSDADGFPDTLVDAKSVPVDRPYAGGKVPPGLTATRPLLAFLDRERLSYDLTTDVALVRRQGPSLSNAPGVAIAGSSRWVPRQLRDGLRREVEDDGLGVVIFGDRSLRRTVAVVRGQLANPSPPRPDDLFGERTRAQRLDAPAPLNQQQDRLRVFAGTDRLFGDFSRLEVSTSLPDDAQPLSAAGREQEGRPAFVGYRFGQGTVIRPGTPQWVSQLEEDALGLEVPRVTENVWRLLRSRR